MSVVVETAEPDWNFTRLTKVQLDVLGRVAIGDDRFIARATGRSLVKRGYLAASEQQQRGAFRIRRYYMPIHVHIRWCEWCSKQMDNV